MALTDATVVFGAGNLGRRVSRVLHPHSICDNNSALWGSSIEGVPVVSPAEAVRQYRDATFIVAIWNPSPREGIVDRIAFLKSLGAREVLSFTSLLPEYGDRLLPHLFWERPPYFSEHQEEIARARALFDAPGREEFDRQLRLHLGDLTGQVIDPEVQYFPSDLVQLTDHEVFIDCGAYDGDTIAAFRHATGDSFTKILAFEPDPTSFAALRQAVHADERITLEPYATGARRETLRFSAAGTGSAVSATGAIEIEAISLDEVLGDIAPTYIKFDIEGSEPDALVGARQVVRRHRPKMAVCVYHAPDHLWSIPLQLHAMLPDYRLSLRTYNADGFDCVCYCVPEES
jgi:FkbM family methyltransferase